MQVVCPYLLDQFYWAEKLCWLEVAPEPLQRQHVTPDSDDSASIVEAAEALSRAIRLALTPEMKEQAAKIAERVSSEVRIQCNHRNPSSLFVYILIHSLFILPLVGWYWRSS